MKKSAKKVYRLFLRFISIYHLAEKSKVFLPLGVYFVKNNSEIFDLLGNCTKIRNTKVTCRGVAAAVPALRTTSAVRS